MAVDLKSHPGLNPDYFSQMEKRRAAIIANKSALSSPDGFPLLRIPVPKQPNKYIPHIGAKQRAKTARWPNGKLDRSQERMAEKSAKSTPPQPIKGDEK